ncbi:MAG: hypothetical protein ABJK11_15970 [Balneola sp.]
MSTKLSSLLLSITFVLLSCNVFGQKTIEVELKKYKRIDKPARDEVSGIVKDPRFDNVLWVHGDSGTKNRIYAINIDGELLPDEDSKGVKIKGVKNKDWEDLAIDEEGNIIIADIGNNCSCRKDQSLIIVNNPSSKMEETEDYKTYAISYEKPDGFLYKFLNYSMDAEALFWKDGAAFVLTKRFRGRDTKLFVLKEFMEEGTNEFKFLQKIDFDDEVTGADFAFGKLAVLTYKSLWIFTEDETADFFDGEVTRYTFEAEQVESVAFLNKDTVIIAEENGDLYKVEL